ncbi:MAG: hypothetical protein CBD16_07525 [Betaproteobacteria bacterium TMED156]|nr:MAG: hypothetical protein CBD16_07525 [Betaproteobacteria bacterium TMED156]
MAWLSSKKDKNLQSFQVQAKKDFDLACNFDEDTRERKSIRIKIALRCRAVIDKTFVEGAEKFAKYKTDKLKAIWDQNKLPPEPEASSFQTINSMNGEIIGYIPKEYANQIFKIAGDYQNEEITIQSAIRQTQFIADEISSRLSLEESFKTLNFLREEFKSSSSEKD